jgi:hypothetical protein
VEDSEALVAFVVELLPNVIAASSLRGGNFHILSTSFRIRLNLSLTMKLGVFSIGTSFRLSLVVEWFAFLAGGSGRAEAFL